MAFQDEVDSLAGEYEEQRTLLLKRLGIGLVILALLAAAGYGAYRIAIPSETTIHHEESSSSDSSATEESQVLSEPSDEEPQPTLAIHVAGAINGPGLYFVPEDARVADVVEQAGGFTPEADIDAINLAAPLSDGQKVHIPAKGESVPTSGGESASSISITESSVIPSPSPRININKASAAELEALSGIGESTAQKIVADRQANGPFETIEDIKRVSGIGDRKFESIKDFICVR